MLVKYAGTVVVFVRRGNELVGTHQTQGRGSPLYTLSYDNTEGYRGTMEVPYAYVTVLVREVHGEYYTTVGYLLHHAHLCSTNEVFQYVGL